MTLWSRTKSRHGLCSKSSKASIICLVDDLPKDPEKPFTINGIHFANRKEYDERVEQDAKAMAELLYDIYQDKKRKELEQSEQSTSQD